MDDMIFHALEQFQHHAQQGNDDAAFAIWEEWGEWISKSLSFSPGECEVKLIPNLIDLPS